MSEQSSVIDYTNYISLVWKSKKLVIAIVAVFSIASVIISLSLPNVYRATSTVLAVDHGSQMSSVASQLGGLAAMAGLNLKGGEVDKVSLAIQILNSRQFQLNFIDKHNLKPLIMAVSSWDDELDKPNYIESLYNPSSKEWLNGEDGRSLEPSRWETYDTFSKLIQIEKKKAANFYQIGFDYFSPKESARIANLLVKDINETMRTMDQERSQKNIDYLNEQLEKTHLTNMQVVFYQLIEEENKTLMLSQAQEEYIFTAIDPAVTPEYRLKPKRALLCIAGATLGGIFAVFIVLAMSFFRELKEK